MMSASHLVTNFHHYLRFSVKSIQNFLHIYEGLKEWPPWAYWRTYTRLYLMSFSGGSELCDHGQIRPSRLAYLLAQIRHWRDQAGCELET